MQTILVSFFILSLVGVIWFYYEVGRRKNEEGRGNIHTELRKRGSEIVSDTILSSYSTTELEMIKEQLRNIAYKKSLEHSLLADEKELLHRFPNTYRITKRRIQKKR